MPVIPKPPEIVTDEVLGTVSTQDRVAVDSSQVPLSFEVLGAGGGDMSREQFVHAYHTIANDLQPAFVAIQNADVNTSSVLRVADHEPPVTRVPVLDTTLNTSKDLTAELESYAEEGIEQVIIQPSAAELAGKQRFDARRLINVIDLARDIKQFSAIGIMLRGGDGYAENLRLPGYAEAAHQADFAVTTPLFNAHSYEDFLRAFSRGQVKAPILPGVLPLRLPEDAADYAARHRTHPYPNLKEQARTLELDTLASVPNDCPTELGNLMMAHTVDLARDLVSLGAPSLHVYTQNNVRLTQRFVDALANPQ